MIRVIKAEVTKDFQYDEVIVAPMFEVQLGLAPASRRTTKEYKKGQVIEFTTYAEYKEFLRLASQYKGGARRVGLPDRKRLKVWAIQATNGRWHFATTGRLRPGQTNKSIRTWSTKASALRAGRREYVNVFV